MATIFRKSSYKWSAIIVAGLLVIGPVLFTNAREMMQNNNDSNKAGIISPVNDSDMIAKKKADNGGPEIIQHDTPITTQILDFVDDPLSKKVINFTNGWVSETKGEIEGTSVSVGAGALTEDPQQGVVLVRVFGENREFVSEKKYLTPKKHGAVKIEGFNGFDLTLKAEDGQNWIFNLKTMEFSE